MRDMNSPTRALSLLSSTSVTYNVTKIVFFLLAVFNCSYLFSQVVNIEQARIRMDTTGWAGIANGNLQSQKYENLLFSASLRGAVQHRIDRRIWLYLADAGFSVADNVQFNNNALAHVRYNYILNDVFQWETFTQMQQNRLLGLDRRNLLGSGPRVTLADSERARVYFGLLGMLELERAKPAPGTFAFGRASGYLSLSVKEPGKFAFTSTTYFQPVLDNLLDYRISGQHAIAFGINQEWSFRVEVTHFYDSRPPEGFVKGTFQSTLGVAYDFGKMRSGNK
jgi:hypothetical protein